MKIFRINWKYIPSLLFIIFLVSFLIFELTGILTLETAKTIVMGSGPLAGLMIIFLLTIDLILPVPSSVLMIMAGSFYGTIVGAVIGTIGSLTASVIGFFIARKISPRILLSKKQTQAMNNWFSRWGEGILIISRMIPIVTETMATFAGLTKISFRRFLILASVGTIPTAFYYSYFGSISKSVSEWSLPLIAGITIPGLLWIILHLKANRR